MAEYLITKRNPCPGADENGDHSLCCDGNGYIESSADLLEVLAKLRWSVPAQMDKPADAFAWQMENLTPLLRLLRIRFNLYRMDKRLNSRTSYVQINHTAVS